MDLINPKNAGSRQATYHQLAAKRPTAAGIPSAVRKFLCAAWLTLAGMALAARADVTFSFAGEEFQGTEEKGKGWIFVNMEGLAQDEVSVKVTAKSGTATMDVDFSGQLRMIDPDSNEEVDLIDGLLTFKSDDRESGWREVIVLISQDDEDEPNETFELELSIPEGGTGSIGDPGMTTFKIIDSSPEVKISVDDAGTVVEGNEGSPVASFTVRLHAKSFRTVWANYTTQSGTASSDVDFWETTGSVELPPGETQVTIDVLIIPDRMVEGDETFTVKLTDVMFAEIERETGTAIILDDDEAKGPIKGDTDCSQYVDFDDIDGFVLALGDPSAYAAAYPNCDIETADVNGDGKIDFNDIDTFVSCVINNGCL